MVEFIGFFISLIALIFLFSKNRVDNQQRRNYPDEFQDNERNQNDPLREFLRTLDEESNEPAIIRSTSSQLPKKDRSKGKNNPINVANKSNKPSTSSLENYRFQSDIEKRRLQSSIERRHLTSSLEKRQQIEEPPRESKEGRDLAKYKSLSNLKEMVIHYEIFNRPKGL